MKTINNSLFNWPIFLIGVLLGAGSLVADPSENPHVVQADYASGDPKSTYQNYLEAVKKADLDVALKCWEYKKEDAAAMDVVVGIWIAHRRLYQAVANKFKTKEDLDVLNGWLRADLTDNAIDLTEKMLLSAKVEVNGDIAAIDMKWKDIDMNKDYFRYPERPTLRKIGKRWKMTVPPDEEFLKKGTWGPLFRDTMIFVNEAAEKMNMGEFKTIMELREFLNAKEKAMTKRHDTDKHHNLPDK